MFSEFGYEVYPFREFHWDEAKKLLDTGKNKVKKL